MKKLLCLLLAAAILAGFAGCGDVSRDGSVMVRFFKAGKADAAVVMTENSVIVVDTGLAKKAEKLTTSLRELGVERIDALIISHFDKDHVGGAAALIEAFDIAAVYQSNHPKNSDEYEAYEAAVAAAGIRPVTVSETVSFSLDGLAVEIDGPGQDAYEDDPSNNSSLIARITFGGNTLLLAGDAQDARLAEYLAIYQRGEGNVILKVPYHGHWQAMLPAFLTAASPSAAIIPCSKDEPEEEELIKTEAYLADIGTPSYRTCNGDVTVLLTETDYTITQ